MELGLTLGDASKSFGFMEKPRNHHQIVTKNTNKKELGLFCMGLSIGSGREDDDEEDVHQKIDDDHDEDDDVDVDNRSRKSREKLNNEPPVQLDLLPLTPVPRNPHHQQQQPSIQAFPWPSSDNGSSGRAGSSGPIVLHTRGFDVNRLPTVVTTTTTEDVEEGAALSSSPSGASSFQMEFSMYRSAGNGNGSGNGNGNGSGSGGGGSKRDYEAVDVEEDDENGSSTRKKLRLSKEQSAFLEESFKEHNTLNPKQKLALAKQLNLRPRQVEVWFQNRRARTKLKQTEVDCEYLKRCCETLTDENRRLHKELQELRALKRTSNNPFYRQLPATTLTMCPSCERVATTTSTTNTTSNTDKTSKTATATATATATGTPTASFSLSRPRFYPFTHTTHQTNQPKAS